MRNLWILIFAFLSIGCATHPESGLEESYHHAQLEWQASANLKCDDLTFEPVDGNIFLQAVSGCEKRQTYALIKEFWYPASSVEIL